jgi:hypothetical protein
LNGNISLRVRATDNVGNVGNPSAPLNLKVDGVAPVVTVNLPAGTLKPTKNGQGNWFVNLTGTADDANGIRPDSLQVILEQQSGVGMPQTQQQAQLNGANWSIDYQLTPGLFDPTGFYNVSARALENTGNAATPATGILRLDVRGTPPPVTMDDDTLTNADTWQPHSGILRFRGQASDSIGLVAVQVRVDDGEFVDATFGNGDWHTALAVSDPEGRTLNVTVRARERAGRVTKVAQAVATVLSAADAPNTSISSGPANSSNQNTAIFAFTGSQSAAVFECQPEKGQPHLPRARHRQPRLRRPHARHHAGCRC